MLMDAARGGTQPGFRSKRRELGLWGTCLYSPAFELSGGVKKANYPRFFKSSKNHPTAQPMQ